MNPFFLSATTLPDAWFQSIYALLDNGRQYVIDHGSYEQQTRLEFDHVTIHIKFPGIRPLLPEFPSHLGIPNPVADGYVESYLPYLMTSDKKPNEEYTYGWYLQDQIAEVIKKVKKYGPNTNQLCMTVGDKDSIYMKDPPCLRLIDVRIQDNQIHFFVYFRSWDLWGGFPANLAAIQNLKEYMAMELGLQDGEMIAMSKGLHIYDYTFRLAKIRTYRETLT